MRGGKARRIAFWIAITLATLLVLVALLSAFPLIVINWFPDELWRAVRTDRPHPGDELHRLHSLALAVIAWGMLLGILAQFHRPERKIAALLAALAVPIAIALGEILAGTYTVAGTAPFLLLILVALVLHPASGELLRLPSWNLPMLGLAAASALPWILYAISVGSGAQGAEPQFEVGHLTFMSALALLTVLWAFIGASNWAGWPFAAVAAVIATASIALQSIFFPGVLSGIPLAWASAALLWCVAYGSAAIWRTRGKAASAQR